MLEKIKNALGIGDDDRDRDHHGSRSIRSDRERHRRTIERKKERFDRSNRDFAEEREELERVPGPDDERSKRRARSARDVRERADRLKAADSESGRVPVGRDPAEYEGRLGDSPIAPDDDREPRPLDEANLPDLPHDDRDDDRDESVVPPRDDLDRKRNGTGPDDRDRDRERERGRSR
jgi:hypothetical protein